jgi:hypothetical protein
MAPPSIAIITARAGTNLSPSITGEVAPLLALPVPVAAGPEPDAVFEGAAVGLEWLAVRATLADEAEATEAEDAWEMEAILAASV